MPARGPTRAGEYVEGEERRRSRTPAARAAARFAGRRVAERTQEPDPRAPPPWGCRRTRARRIGPATPPRRSHRPEKTTARASVRETAPEARWQPPTPQWATRRPQGRLGRGRRSDASMSARPSLSGAPRSSAPARTPLALRLAAPQPPRL